MLFDSMPPQRRVFPDRVNARSTEVHLKPTRSVPYIEPTHSALFNYLVLFG